MKKPETSPLRKKEQTELLEPEEKQLTGVGVKKIPEKIKRTYEISGQLTRDLKLLAFFKNITINELVEIALTEYVNKHKDHRFDSK